MELVEVEITGQAITARYGTLSTGDILKTDQAYAEHLINDCHVAKWRESKAAAPEVDDQLENEPIKPVEPAEPVVAEVLVIANAAPAAPAKTKAKNQK